MDELPVEVVGLVLQQLEPQDLIRSAFLVCRSWREICARHLRKVAQPLWRSALPSFDECVRPATYKEIFEGAAQPDHNSYAPHQPVGPLLYQWQHLVPSLETEPSKKHRTIKSIRVGIASSLPQERNEDCTEGEWWIKVQRDTLADLMADKPWEEAVERFPADILPADHAIRSPSGPFTLLISLLAQSSCMITRDRTYMYGFWFTDIELRLFFVLRSAMHLEWLVPGLASECDEREVLTNATPIILCMVLADQVGYK